MLETLCDARGLELITITREQSQRLDAFFARWNQPFPERVARDPGGRLHKALSITAYPTFVRLDHELRVQARKRGGPRKGELKLP